jgi:hypothetical protein
MVVYAEDRFQQIESKQDDCPPYGQGEDGYGNKISMPYLVRLDGKGPWRRVYCVCFSNAGSLYIIVKGEKYFFRQTENLRLQGVWPQ